MAWHGIPYVTEFLRKEFFEIALLKIKKIKADMNF